MKIIVGAGMPGSGKGLLTKAASELGLPIIILGDLVREKAKEWGISPLEAGQRIRDENGPAGVAKLALEKLKGIKGDVVYIDGVRSRHEIEEFKKLGDVVVIAIHASPKVRFKRLYKRGRPDDPKTWEEFVARDEKELSRGLAKVIARADFVIDNNDEGEETVYKECIEKIKKALNRDP